jgi:predicted nucleic acid-binding protein
LRNPQSKRLTRANVVEEQAEDRVERDLHGRDREETDALVVAQRQLARVGHHRLPPVDLLVAAIADRHGLGVLHYDRDYDLLAEKTDLDVGSVWLAPAGSL